MLKLIEFVRSKSLTDTSMAMGLRMIEENAGMQEDCILAIFEAIYISNQKLANEVLKLRAKSPKITLASK
jgi:hypothetical protein